MSLEYKYSLWQEMFVQNGMFEMDVTFFKSASKHFDLFAALAVMLEHLGRTFWISDSWRSRSNRAGRMFLIG
jgi:hypothetical protein